MECKDTYGRMQPVREDSPLTQLASNSWGGRFVAPHVSDLKAE